MRSRAQLAAENPFSRKRLALDCGVLNAMNYLVRTFISRGGRLCLKAVGGKEGEQGSRGVFPLWERRVALI